MMKLMGAVAAHLSEKHGLDSQSSNSGCLPYSDLVSPSYYYSNDIQQNFRDFENNDNELMKLDQKNLLQQLMMTSEGKQGLELLSDEDLDYFDGGINGLINPN